MSDLKGQVYKSTGSWYVVKDDKGEFWSARIKGKLKIDKDISSTNPVAVGDVVLFDVEDETQKTAVIRNIDERHNYIVRVSPRNRNQRHIVAANLDAAVVIATIANPRTSTGFIDRFLITAEAYHIPAIVVVNKTDLLFDKQLEQLEHWRRMYQAAGYEVFDLSAVHEETLAPLVDRIKGITTLFSGHSGVGKSTLLNLILPEADLKTREVSEWSGKGQHTTTFAEMFDIPAGGRIIDTPGVKEFGLIGFEKEDLAQYFPEMRKLMSECKFHNCLHVNEPGCAVKEAFVNGSLEEDRYMSYLSMLETLESKW
ncbi:MAG: ribosome small subunit-dependent GTPase A [Chitinophagales bacterium]|nr:ribosome small subunit-dependent GTPase A [Chitinophagaceae bacterium]MCB9065079.1 ribosome small subunit-dependent GTPase A [Chitinophagales bacterium]